MKIEHRSFFFSGKLETDSSRGKHKTTKKVKKTPCKWCTYSSKLTLWAILSNYLSSDEAESFEVNFCPHCGRKLAEE